MMMMMMISFQWIFLFLLPMMMMGSHARVIPDRDGKNIWLYYGLRYPVIRIAPYERNCVHFTSTFGSPPLMMYSRKTQLMCYKFYDRHCQQAWDGGGTLTVPIGTTKFEVKPTDKVPNSISCWADASGGGTSTDTNTSASNGGSVDGGNSSHGST